MSAELERLAAEFEKFQSKIEAAERKFSGVGEMQERLAELEAVAISPDRTVRVVAGPGGAVKDIQLTPDAMRLPSTGLAATIMTTLRTAVAEAVNRQVGIIDDTVGGELAAGTAEQVRQAQLAAFGTEAEAPASNEDAPASGYDFTSQQDEPAARPPAPPQQPAPLARPRRSRRDDDDFTDDSIYG